MQINLLNIIEKVTFSIFHNNNSAANGRRNVKYNKEYHRLIEHFHFIARTRQKHNKNHDADRTAIT
jgi:hypothetical protein